MLTTIKASPEYCLEKVLPMLQVEDIPLGFPEDGKLLFTMFLGEFSSLKILTAENRVDILQTRTPKAQGDAYPEKLVRCRLNEEVIGRGLSC